MHIGENCQFSNAFRRILLPQLRICSGPAADRFHLITRKYRAFYFQLTCGNLWGGLYPNFLHCQRQEWPHRAWPSTCRGADLSLGRGSCVHRSAVY